VGNHGKVWVSLAPTLLRRLKAVSRTSPSEYSGFYSEGTVQAAEAAEASAQSALKAPCGCPAPPLPNTVVSTVKAQSKRLKPQKRAPKALWCVIEMLSKGEPEGLKPLGRDNAPARDYVSSGVPFG